jgi:hypothetical protein
MYAIEFRRRPTSRSIFEELKALLSGGKGTCVYEPRGTDEQLNRMAGVSQRAKAFHAQAIW